MKPHPKPVKRSVPKGLPRSHIVRDAIFPAPTKTTLFYWAKVSCATRQQARAVVKNHNFKDPGVRALAQAAEALKGCKNRRELNATISFLVDHFITHPSRELPPHLQRTRP